MASSGRSDTCKLRSQAQPQNTRLPHSANRRRFCCALHLHVSKRSPTLVRMTDVRPHNETPGNPFEFGITLLICVAISATIALLICGVAFLYWK